MSPIFDVAPSGGGLVTRRNRENVALQDCADFRLGEGTLPECDFVNRAFVKGKLRPVLGTSNPFFCQSQCVRIGWLVQ